MHRPLPPRSACVLVRGRSPGLEVLPHRLPGYPSGILMRPRFLTVAGAAPESNEVLTGFPFHWMAVWQLQHRGRVRQ